MTFDQKLTAAIAQLAMLACLVGLVRKRRWRLCYGFTAYVVAIVTLGPLQTWWPSRFNTWGYWSFKQTVYDALKLTLAVELTWRVCRWFPGAKASAERWVLGVLLLSALGLFLRPWSHDPLLEFAGELRARAATCTVWLFVATALAIWHYRLVVHPFHLGVLMGLASYLTVFGTVTRLMQVQGWAGYVWWRALDPPAYVLCALWLAWVAWRDDGDDAANYDHIIELLRARRAA